MRDSWKVGRLQPDERMAAAPLCPQRSVDRTPSDAETLRDRRGPQLGPQSPDLRRVDADRAPFVLPRSVRLGDALACRSSMISRSHVATPARMVSISLLVGLRVSSRSPPIDRTTRPMPRFDRAASNRQQLGRAARQPVRLGHGQHVALAQEGEALGELRPLRGARYLLAEDAFGAGRLEAGATATRGPKRTQ